MKYAVSKTFDQDGAPDYDQIMEFCCTNDRKPTIILMGEKAGGYTFFSCYGNNEACFASLKDAIVYRNKLILRGEEDHRWIIGLRLDDEA